ncbi:hypothetical protein ES705_27555 [subsurface metagenome]
MENKEIKKHPFNMLLDKIMEKIEIVFSGFATILMIGMALILGINIALRFLLHHSIHWSNEVSRYAYIYIVLLGTAVSYKTGSHAKISFIHDAVSKNFKIIFNVLHYAVMLLLSFILIIPGIKHVINMWPVHAPVLTFFPVGIIYISVPLSAGAILLFVISKITGIHK